LLFVVRDSDMSIDFSSVRVAAAAAQATGDSRVRIRATRQIGPASARRWRSMATGAINIRMRARNRTSKKTLVAKSRLTE
jgi:hypothetical protein